MKILAAYILLPSVLILSSHILSNITSACVCMFVWLVMGGESVIANISKMTRNSTWKRSEPSAGDHFICYGVSAFSLRLIISCYIVTSVGGSLHEQTWLQRCSHSVYVTSSGAVCVRWNTSSGCVRRDSGSRSGARCLLLFAFAVQFTKFCWEACRNNASYLGSIMNCEVAKTLKEAVMPCFNIPPSLYFTWMSVCFQHLPNLSRKCKRFRLIAVGHQTHLLVTCIVTSDQGTSEVSLPVHALSYVMRLWETNSFNVAVHFFT